MKKVGNHKSISKIITLSLAFVLSISLSSFAQNAPAATGDAVAGKALFNANCAACHKLDAKMTGPALRGVAERRNRAWLGKWIKDSKALIASGDADAVKVFEENNKIPMAGFPQLSDADVDNIIAYTSEAKPVEEAAKLPDAKESAGNEGVTNEMILGLLVFVLAALVTMLLLVNNVLRKIAKANNVEVAKTDKFAIWKAFVKNQFLVLVSVVLFMLVSLYFV